VGAKILESRISFKEGTVLAVLATLALLLFLQAPAWAATFTVNAERDAPDANPGDGQCATAAGDCTLRAAVMEANANGQADTIDLPAGDYDLTIAGEDNNARAGDLDITTGITINGAGRDSTTVNGEAVDRSFEVRDGATAEISGVTVTEGGAGSENDDTDEGGGILVRKGSGLTLNDSAVTGNSAKKKGGGIFNDGTLDINNTNIDNNQAADEGGGIFNKRGALELTRSTVSGNDAKKGAGIYDENKDAPVTLIGTSVNDNVSDEEGGGIFNKRGALHLRDSTVSGNEAGREGGGIFNESKESPLTVTDSTVSNNSSDEDGGGIFNEKGAFEVTRSTVDGNTAGTNGGGIRNNGGEALLDAVNSTISNNTANNEGGGIRNNDGETRLLNVTLNQNSGAQGSNLSSLGNVIFVENTIVANGQNSPNCAGPINSQGDNLDTGASCGFDQASDIENGNPNLGPLRDNGGPTKTHALRVESDAIDAANNGPCPATDQRNESRPQDGNGDGQASCDIGAFENQPSDLTIQKDAPETADAGEEFTYTITVTNNGPGTASGAEFTDRLPDGVTPSGDLPQDCTYNAQDNTVTCDIGTLANGETVEKQIQVTSSTTGEKVNEAEITSNPPDPDESNNTATATTTVSATSDLAVDKQAPEQVAQNEEFTYTVTVENNGPNEAEGVTLTDELPDGVTPSGPLPGDCTYDEASNTITCDIGTLADGASAERQFQVTADSSGDKTNTATVESQSDDPNAQNDSDSATTEVDPDADLVVRKSDSQDPVLAGEDFTYTLTVENNGPDSAEGVTLTDRLPDGVTPSGPLPDDCTYDEANNTITCDLGTLQSDESVQRQFDVTAQGMGEKQNTAAAESDTADPQNGNDSDSATTSVDATADLAAGKNDSQDPVLEGEEFTYTVSATNNGPSRALDVTITDRLPANVEFVSAGDGCEFNENDPADPGDDTVVCQVGTVDNGNSAERRIQVRATENGAAENVATVDSSTNDDNPGNDRVTETTQVQPVIDLSVNKQAPDETFRGDEFTYTLTVTNNDDNDTATGVTLVDELPNGVEPTDGGLPPDCTYDAANNTVTCDISQLGPGQSAERELQVRANTAGEKENNARVSGDQADNDESNNRDMTMTQVNPVADLSVEKSDSQDPVLVGEEFTYTVKVTNNGPNRATDVRLVDRLPDGVTPSGPLPDNCNYDEADNTITCDVGSLPDAENRDSVTYEFDVTSNSPGRKTNEAEITGNTRDNNPDNDSATEETVVSPAANLSLTMQAPDRVNDEQKFTYTLVVENEGPSPAAGVTITDDLPKKVEFISASNGCAEANGEVTCEVGALQAGEKAERKVTVRAKEPGKATSTANVESATAERERRRTTTLRRRPEYWPRLTFL
jgi:uncharacterized repeat protein (TIGR01451 family)